jgi:hypothetical protein
MPKPDLKAKNDKDHPTVRIKLECDRRVTVLPHTCNSSVTNLLNKNRLMITIQLAFQLLGQVFLFRLREREVELSCSCV